MPDTPTPEPGGNDRPEPAFPAVEPVERPGPQRRINPDRPPWDRLPAIRADSRSGPIRVTRGTFDPDDLRERERNLVLGHHGEDYVVFTNSLGQHLLGRRGQLIYPDLDLSRMGWMPHRLAISQLVSDKAYRGLTFPQIVARFRAEAERLNRVADRIEGLIDTGWVQCHEMALTPYGDMIDTSTEAESYAPLPKGRTRRPRPGEADPTDKDADPKDDV